jgi:hypothetical protein
MSLIAISVNAPVGGVMLRVPVAEGCPMVTVEVLVVAIRKFTGTISFEKLILITPNKAKSKPIDLFENLLLKSIPAIPLFKIAWFKASKIIENVNSQKLKIVLMILFIMSRFNVLQFACL